MTGAPGQPVALVTGAGRGIGREIALALAREGCPVAVVARSSDQVEATAAAVASLGVPSMALVLDVTDERAVARGVAAIVARLGRVDVLVNNAGIAESAPFAKTNAALWDRHLRVNATAPYLLARAVLPRNIAARTGTSFEEAVAAMARLNPGGRLIEPAEVAAVAAKLIHDDTTNGEAIVLDGTACLRAAGRRGAGAPPSEASL